ncbi:MAG TPA: hypothetical protein VK204_14775 [Nocardioidaceae bacterium]|nr:hypothetical protein [Nocardioidaceae bacterium]
MGTTTALPRSADLAAWFTAWATGAASLDDARDAIVGGDAAHDVVGLPGESDPVPLILALGKLRGSGAVMAGLALPAPGDPLGLAGPTGFNADALEAEEAVVFDGVDAGLVPHVAGAGVSWRFHEATSRRQVPDIAEADTMLRQAVLAAADTLADLDVARWRPEVADELMALRSTVDLALPPHWNPRQVRLASLSMRCRTIVDLALDDDGGAVSAAEADARKRALAPLDHAARRGLVAACSQAHGR